MTLEEQDSRILESLEEAPYPYQNESRNRDINVDGELYSIKWILTYAWARRSGVACMWSSSDFASRPRRCRFTSQCGWEYHDILRRGLDCRLLYLAQQHLISRPPKGRRKKTVNQ
jgi:hypothetical protein